MSKQDKELKKLIEEENRRNPESKDFTGMRWQILALLAILMGIMFYGIFFG